MLYFHMPHTKGMIVGSLKICAIQHGFLLTRLRCSGAMVNIVLVAEWDNVPVLKLIS